MGRPKRPKQELRSVEECNEAMRLILVATTHLESVVALRDRQVALTQQAFEPEIDARRGQIADATAQLQHYYMTHLAEIEQGNRRSLALTYGVIGRRATPKALKLLGKSWNWDAVKVKIRELFGVDDYFHPAKEREIDKDKIKRDLSDEQLKECGLKAEGGEEFYAEPDRTAKIDL